MVRRLHVCLLWHHHQPPYRDATNHDTGMPWARLHAVKAYTDMAAICEAVPDAHVTFNLVPSLLDQLDDIAAGTDDAFARLTQRPADQLTPDERERLARTFFSAPFETMIAPWPRYRELHHAAQGRLHDMTPDELRDLQTWFNLAWCGPTVRREHTAELISKGRNYNPADKTKLLAIHRQVAGEVTARYRALQDRGQVELTCSPHYHPILPLLIDSTAARQAKPDAVLPSRSWRHPEDATQHLERAHSSHSERFGRPPAGLWPSEGAISAEAVELIGAAGFRWLVTDQGLLHKSRRGAAPDIYAPWDSGSGVSGFFRDIELSDQIGFVYSRWRTEDAVGDFLDRIRAIRDGLTSDVGVVTIALDGENCWEHYPSDSPGLLVPLYEALLAEPGLQMSTFAEALEDVGTTGRVVTQVATGSWIGGDLETWMGHPHQNRAWEELAAVREQAPEDMPIPDALMRAQASDWFWWLGPHHSTPFETDFTQLFANNLQAAAEELGVPPRQGVVAHVLGPAAAEKVAADAPPTRPMTLPVLDGDDRDFFRWLGAGRLSLPQDAMARARRVETIRYGHDREHLWLRLEPGAGLDGFQIDLATPGGGLLAVFPERSDGVRSAMGSVLEVGVPLDSIPCPDGERRQLAIVFRRLGEKAANERLPRSGWFLVGTDLAALALEHWSV